MQSKHRSGAPRSALQPAPSPQNASPPDRHEAILNAAERLFAASGFAGTSMRAIAEEAQVVQSLLHYHFGTKEGLFEAVFARRAHQINEARIAKLERELARGALDLPTLLEILLRATVQLGRDESSGTRHFSRMIMSVAVSQEERDKQLMAAHFDEFALRFVDALQVVLPGLSRRDAVWGYLFSVGVAMTMMAPTGRSDRLSGGLCRDADNEEVLQRVIRFAEAGVLASIGPQRRERNR